MIKEIIVGVLLGLPVGWFGNFFYWVTEKRSARWAWLLCQPWPLSNNQKDELVEFYL